jgi:transcriptional regulator with GAF, ATPase, and Fis domain
MSKLKNIKLYSFLTFALFISLFLVMTMQAGNKYELFFKENWLFIAILPLLTFSLFVMVIQLIIKTERTENKFEDFKKQSEQRDHERQEKKRDEEVQVEIIDFSKEKDKLLKRINKAKNIEAFTEEFLTSVSKEFDLVSGLFYLKDEKDEQYNCISTYAYYSEEYPKSFKPGEGLNGQVVKNKTALYLEEVPENHISVMSGTGKGNPRFLSILPLESKNKVFGVIELASFTPQSENLRKMIMDMGEDIVKLIGEIKK